MKLLSITITRGMAGAAFLLLILCISCGEVNTPIEKFTSSPNIKTSTSTIGPKKTVTPIQTLTITTSITSTFSATPLPNNDQTEASIPNCQESGGQDLYPLPDNLNGLIYYGNQDGSEFFLLQGKPIESKRLYLGDTSLNNLTFSKDEKWLLAYAKIPESAQGSDRYPVQFISNNGEKILRYLDISWMTQEVQTHTSKTSHFLYWSLTWLNENIITVRAAYGEGLKGSIPDFIYGYYDFTQNEWWDSVVNTIPHRAKYMWISISPDLTRSLYVDSNFSMTLWDLVQQKVLWTKPTIPYAQIAPYASWSYDNQKVAFWTLDFPKAIQVLTSSGMEYSQVKPISFPKISQSFSPYRGFFEWSPNDYRLAITGPMIDENQKVRKAMMYIYDISTDKYTYSCPMGDTDKGTVASSVLWSKDGNYLIPQFPQSDTIPFNIYDIINGGVYKVDRSGFAAYGWVTAFNNFSK